MIEGIRTLQSLGVCAAVAALLLGMACSKGEPSGSDAAASPTAGLASAATDGWLGQWTGPEGTFLRIAGGDGRYEITIQNLDGPRTFGGSAAGDRIEFDRDGARESIRATNGAGTGMKWLADKSNCLTVKPGEGYCRD